MQTEEIGLQHYFEVLWRRKWAIGVVFGIVFCLSAIGISVSKTTYKVHSKVAVKNNIYYRTSMFSFAPGTDAPATTLSGETYEEIINGLPFAQRVADYLLQDGLPLDPLAVRSSLRAEYQEPDLIRIHATSEEPDIAVRLANAAADVFVEDTKEYMREQLRQGRESALSRQEMAKKDLQEIDEEIGRFRHDIGSVDIDSEMESLRDKLAIFEQARGQEITKVEVAEARRQELEILARAAAAGEIYLDDPRLDEYRVLQQALADARIRYTPDHPTLKNLTNEIEAIENRLKEAINRAGSNLSPEAFLTLKEDLAKADAEIANIQTGIDSWTRQIEGVRIQLAKYPDKRAQLQSLTAKKTAAEESYKLWSGRLEEIDFKASKVPANAELVDQAIAPSPSIGKGTAMGLAVIISLMLALGTGFMIEFADTTLRTPEEITGTIGLGFLGSIVKLKDPKQQMFSGGKPMHEAAETYMRVYSNIKFAEIENPFRSILVTSARKGEGKSTTLINLACAISAAGKKVIIVDSDLRNPTLQRLLGSKHAAGLTSVIAGEASLDDVLRTTEHPGLTLLPAGPIPPNPAELLHSQAMKEIIHDLENRADLIIFDTPPTLLVADAMLLGSELDAAILVAESGGISRKAVQQVKESLQLAKIRVLGVILNKIQESPGSYYNYYYSYYQYSDEPERQESASTPKSWIKQGLGNIRKSMGGRG